MASARRLAAVTTLCAAAAAPAQSLPELLEQALARDPAVAAAQAQVRAAEERVVQSRAGFGPTAQLTANQTENRYYEAPEFSLRPFRSKQLALQVTQPLWRGALLHSLEGAQAQLGQAQAALEQARGEASQRLVEAAFELLKARDALVYTQAQKAATLEQLAQAQRSFQVGTVAVTDVRDAEAKADAVSAQIVAAEVELDLRQQVLAEIAGRPAPALRGRALGGERLPPLQAPQVLDWLSAAQGASPQVRQAQQALAAAEAEIRKAWQGHAPTADLTYNYTISSDTGTATSLFPRRADSQAVGVQVNIPIFASGATQSKVVETVALRDKAQAELETARRNVVLGVRQNFSAVLSAIGQAHGLETAVRSQEVALRASRRGYEVGMKVNSEVLDAQTKLFEARRDLSRARYDAWLNYARLKVQAGRFGIADAAELDALLADAPPSDLQGTRRPGAEPAK